MRKVLPRRLAAALKLSTVVGFAVLFGACGAMGSTSETYDFAATATRSSGAGTFDVTLTDEVTTTVLVSAVGAATPASVSFAGTIDYTTTQTVSVVVTGNAMAAGESMTVTVTYTDNSYDPPVTRTVDSYTVANTGAGGSNITSEKPFVLPID